MAVHSRMEVYWLYQINQFMSIILGMQSTRLTQIILVTGQIAVSHVASIRPLWK